LFALLGYNREYCHANNLLFNSGDYQQLAYKYTSICFAWCVVEDRIITRISEYSDPILIDRQAISLYKDSSNKYQLESKECSLSYDSVDNYYSSSIIHLTTN
jgi:hypothetical protein